MSSVLRRRRRRAWRWVTLLAPLALLLVCAPGGAASGTVTRTARGMATHHDEYVFVDHAMYVYDADHGERLLARRSLPGIAGVRGVAADIRTHALYISYGGYGGGYDGSLARYDLLSNRIVWTRSYGTGVDSLAVSRNGARLYLPDGELSTDGIWLVLNARSGAVIARIRGGNGPHNTVVGASGRWVYLGPRNSPYLSVASTATDRVIRRIGPLYSGVRPFTVNASETLAYTTATGLLGFQVSSIRTGHVLYTVRFGPRFKYDRGTFPYSAPSHGISLSPEGRRVWVIDSPNSFVHVYDVAGVPRHAPRHLVDIKLTHALSGDQSDCAQDCGREGWLQPSVDGCLVYVGDAGEVLSAVTYRPVAYLPALRNSREMLEIDWRGGMPVATSTRTGLGYPRRSPPNRARCAGG
ncbi:MAG TPA: hypothetical protein VKV21_15180 [Solirubrobacteraceae bacterium]|nr:hypothetical protein [Solirubrobacteraceae bacterium]